MTRKCALLVAVVLLATAAHAQDFFRGYGRGNRVPPRLPKVDSYDGSFSFCRGLYTSGYREQSGSGWNTDYPDADVNFSIRLSELTKVRVGKQPTGDPNHLVVPVTDDFVFQCPWLHLEDAGTALFTEAEVAQLRLYLTKGGFIWADDSWGNFALSNWEEQIGRVLPAAEYPIRDITPEHPVFTTMFQVQRMPQIPSISHWRRSGGGTSERPPETDTVVVRGINNRDGHLMVLMTHNTDISDAWEREGEDPQYFYSFSPNGYAVGINVLMYAMTH